MFVRIRLYTTSQGSLKPKAKVRGYCHTHAPMQNTDDATSTSPLAIEPLPAHRIFTRFLGFGARAFGGPTAQIALLHEELVTQDRWVSEERFRRALAVYQALPGPEAHELCCWFGMLRGGRLGAIAAGAGFMLPGVALMLIASVLYTQFHDTQGFMQPMLVAVQAAIAGVILRAAWLIFRRMTRTRVTLCIAIVACVSMLALHFFAPASALESETVGARIPTIPPQALALFRDGLWGGLTSFGGAYVAIPVLEATSTGPHGWMQHTQFLDAIAIASVLPAPLVVFATFVGYIGGGWSGALAMTAGIFLPAFSFTLIGHNFFERVMQMPRLHALLDGVAAIASGVVCATAILLTLAALQPESASAASLHSALPFALFLGGLLVATLYRRIWTSVLIVATAALIGVLSSLAF